MAFEADCGLSTVLETIGVASTVRFPVPGEWPPCGAGVSPACAAGTAAPQETLDSFSFVGTGVSPTGRLGGKFETRNSKSVLLGRLTQNLAEL